MQSKQQQQRKQQRPKTTQAPKTSKKKNTAPRPPASRQAPLARSNRVTTQGRSIRVRHRELITSQTYSPGPWALQVSELINPGNVDMFPWLSNVALSYEKYKFHKLHFEIVPYNPATVLGYYTVAIDYDPNDPDPPSDEVMSAFSGTQTNNIWEKTVLAAHTANLLDNRQSKYITSVPYTASDDHRMTAGGKFLFAVAGASPCSVKIFVNYDVELLIPQLLDKALTTQGLNHRFSKVGGTNTTEIVSAFVNAPVASGSPVTLANGGDPRQMVMNFNRVGQYFVRIAQTGIDLTNPVVATGANPYYDQNITTTGTTGFSNSFMLDVNNPGPVTFTWPAATISTLTAALVTATRLSQLTGQIV